MSTFMLTVKGLNHEQLRDVCNHIFKDSEEVYKELEKDHVDIFESGLPINLVVDTIKCRHTIYTDSHTGFNTELAMIQLGYLTEGFGVIEETYEQFLDTMNKKGDDK